jgi:hypothetical protein
MTGTCTGTDWRQAVLVSLKKVDTQSAAYINDRCVKIGFYKQGPHTSAIWFPGQRIFLNPRYYSLETDPSDPLLLSILIHEVCHLRQGFALALSVYGEMEAWQLGFSVHRQLSGIAYHPNLVEFMSLPLSWDRDVLRRAQQLMLGYAGKSYRADLLPLYPIGKELVFWLGLGRSAEK